MKNQNKDIKETKIYLITNITDNPYEIYIGQTKNPNTRLSNHRNKYHKDIKMTILDEIKTQSRQEWKQLEAFWLSMFQSWGFKLDNKNNGGNGANQFSKESIDKLRKAKKGQTYSKFAIRVDKGKLRPNSTHNKPVNQYSLDGTFIKQWNSAREAQRFINGKDMGSVGDCCREKCKTGYKFKWSYV